MYKTSLIAILLAGFTCSAQQVAADNHQALLASVNKFRGAVVEFERVVQKTRGIRVADKNIVDRFEKATKRMALVAQNPRNLNRLRYEYREVQPFQQKAEEAIFGKYTLNHDLVKAWQRVFYTQLTFEQEFAFQLEYNRHGNSVRLRQENPQPNQTFLPMTAGASLPDLPADQLQFSEFYIPQSATLRHIVARSTNDQVLIELFRTIGGPQWNRPA